MSENATLHAKHQHLTNPQDGTTGKVFTYTCDHNLSECLKDGYFDTLRSNLLPGDSIRLVQKDTLAELRKARVLAVLDAMVVAIEAPHVFVRPCGERWTFKFGSATEAASAQSDERYVEETGEVKWNPGTKTHDVIVKGEVVAKLTDKETAHRIAHGDAPLPVAA
jgi:hypothetical protein